MADGLVPIRFVLNYAQYNAGEIAGFAPHIAKRLIEAKVAVPYEPPQGRPRAEPAQRPRRKRKTKPSAVAPRTRQYFRTKEWDK